MSQTQGPKQWQSLGGTPALQLGVYFDGAFVRSSVAGARPYYPEGFQLDNVAGASLLQSPIGSNVQQSVWLGGDMPVNANAISGRWQFKIAVEDDYQRFVTAESRGQAVELWFDWPMADHWRIAGADAGATLWRTMRRQPWHIAGVSHATRPPVALIDGVEKTIVTSGSPSVGEIKVTDTGGAIGVIETHPTDTASATWLELRYPAVLLVVVSNVSRQLSDFNHFVVSADFAEHLEGTYTPPAGA